MPLRYCKERERKNKRNNSVLAVLRSNCTVKREEEKKQNEHSRTSKRWDHRLQIHFFMAFTVKQYAREIRDTFSDKGYVVFDHFGGNDHRRDFS